jgi:exodeoxyribonuclease V
VSQVDSLSEDQKIAYDAILAWCRDKNRKPVFTLGGYAGVGKTRLTGIIGSLPFLQPIAFCAYTGKASSVLRSKLENLKPRSKPYFDGCPYKPTSFCGTIHSLIYKPILDGQAIVGWEAREELDAPYKLIVADEASMISDDLLMDLRSYGVPILAVGDHGQLPPVGGQGSLMSNPDIRLEKIHRQAEGNPIIALSKNIRETGKLDRKHASDQVRFVSRSMLNDLIEERFPIVTKETKRHELRDAAADVILTYTNASRVYLNQRARSRYGISGPPQVGDQVVCLKNVRGQPIYNGMRGIIQHIHGRHEKFPWQLKADIRFEGQYADVNQAYFTASMLVQQFNREKTFNDLDEVSEVLSPKKTIKLFSWDQVGHLFDFGYALTVHKSQGSQWEDVLTVIERAPWMKEGDWRRLMYTAVTRSSSKLTIVT